MIEETSKEVSMLGENAADMRKAGENAMSILAELEEINIKTMDAIQIIGEQTQKTNESAVKIKVATDMISEIAEETTLLSLNASIEAARAGEQGKGFAVVAEEVRNLAGRSAEASRQTAEMIEDSIEKVKHGSALVGDTERALEVISDMIDNIMGLSANISSASSEQATATSQIDDALAQVAQVVQTNSATSEECASASEELSGQAHGLENILTRFKIKDGQNNFGYISNNGISDDYNSDIRLETTYDTKY